MRSIQPELQARLDSGATSLCRCWKIERKDGQVLGFTDHDAPLMMDGTVYLASTGMDAGVLQTSNGLSVDNAQVVGALSAEAISEADVHSGRYDEARVFQWLVDWQRTDLKILMFSGSIGEIRRNDSTFEVELRGPTEALNAPVGRTILKTCDRTLGDLKCGFDTSDPAFVSEAAVIDMIGETGLQVSGLGEFENGWFQHGVLTWLSGANMLERTSVKTDAVSGSGARVVGLWREPAYPVATGDRFKIVAGCDKRFATCKTKFGNILNFGGFPDLPGEDWVTAYPTEGSVHDGSSRKS